MKRVISLLLCCVMCMSIFATSASAVIAAEAIDNYITVTASEFKDETITFTVSLAPNQKSISGAVVYMKYDPAVLEVQECAETGAVQGIVAFGNKYDDATVYSAGYTNTSGVDIGDVAKALYTITFKVISEERPMANVTFSCAEFKTADGVDNDIAQTDAPVVMESFDFLTISVPEMISACSSVDGIIVEWKSTVGATGYDLYRMADGETEWALICENHNGTTYEDTTINLGTEYTYCVAARNEHGVGQKSGNPVFTMNFGAIAEIDATATATGALVEWSQLDGADSYDVYRKKVANSDWVKIANTTATSYADNKIESYVEYNYKVEAVQGVYRAGLADEIPVVKYLAMPEAAVTNGEEGIEVYFGKVNGAEEYVVEKSVDGEFTEVYTSTVGDTKFVDTDVSANGAYEYRVYAKASDINSEYVKFSAITRLGVPSVKVPTSIRGGMKVTWSAVDGAEEYGVYRTVYGSDNYVLVGTTDGTTYTDTSAKSGVVYTYTVSAMNDTGCGPKNSDGGTALYLAAPKLKSRSNVVGGVKFVWEAVEGATSYRVYRKTNSSGWALLAICNGNTTSYIDKGKNYKGKSIGMKNGTTYKYTVRATNANREDYGVTYPGGYDKDINSGYHTGGLAIKYVAAPTLKTISNTKNGIKITWNKVSGAKKYKVYRRLSTSSVWSYIGDTTSTSYTDTGTKSTKYSGKIYYYSVAAVNTYTSARNTTGLKIKRLTNPTLVSAKSSKTGITVKWKKVTGCTGYYIYRKTSKTGYKRIAIVNGISKVSYLDKSARKGTTYTYTVRARYGSSLSSYNTGLSCKDRY